MATAKRSVGKKVAARQAAGSTRPAAPPQAAAAVPGLGSLLGGDNGVMGLAQQFQSWASSVLQGTGTLTDMSAVLAKAKVSDPGQREVVEKGASLLRDVRETAGLSLEQLRKAMDLKDLSLLQLVESGKAGLPFELILRMAAVLGRNDPWTFAMNFTRAYNPQLWKVMEDIGFGKLLVQAGREREFANLYRGNDAARALSDAAFAKTLTFLGAALTLAVETAG